MSGRLRVADPDFESIGIFGSELVMIMNSLEIIFERDLEFTKIAILNWNFEFLNKKKVFKKGCRLIKLQHSMALPFNAMFISLNRARSFKNFIKMFVTVHLGKLLLVSRIYLRGKFIFEENQWLWSV